MGLGRRLRTILIVFVLYLVYIGSNISLYFGSAVGNDSSHGNDILSGYLLPDYNSAPGNTNSYRSRYHKSAPSAFNDWRIFAFNNNCSTDLSYYDQVVRDFQTYLPGTILSNQQDIFSSETSEGHFSSGSFISENVVMRELFGSWVSQITQKNFSIVFNDWDMPRLIPSSSIFLGSKELFQIENSCARNIFRDRVLLNYNYYLRTGQERSRNGYIYTESSAHMIFSQAKTLCFQDILIPMGYDWAAASLSISDNIPFSEKSPVLFWRGTNTGSVIKEEEDWEQFIRVRALIWEENFRNRYPDRVFSHGQSVSPVSKSKFLVDIALNQYQNCPDTFKNRFSLKPSVSFDDMKLYKYLLVLDGNSWPSRLQTLLQFNSVILYPRLFFNWYSWYLQPFVHFVPINIDLSDLEEKVQWLEDNPDKAQIIVENAQAVMKIFSRREQLQCHTAFALMHLNDIVA